ncbi:HNH endonuclease [Streptomyces sp. NPDC007074]|uniref:HNH endonuclease n=1 Tax=Streptomyces sp. NPDC007074 TaxID=3156764 RepID=UPI0033F81693
MKDGIRYHALAHRLVWRHFAGPIPAGLTVNHKNGVKSDNRPANLELATHAEQTAHARQVLRRGRLDQYGIRNAMVKLTPEQVQQIKARRAKGETLASIAEDYPVRMQHISRITRGDRRSRG